MWQVTRFCSTELRRDHRAQVFPKPWHRRSLQGAGWGPLGTARAAQSSPNWRVHITRCPENQAWQVGGAEEKRRRSKRSSFTFWWSLWWAVAGQGPPGCTGARPASTGLGQTAQSFCSSKTPAFIIYCQTLSYQIIGEVSGTTCTT